MQQALQVHQNVELSCSLEWSGCAQSVIVSVMIITYVQSEQISCTERRAVAYNFSIVCCSLAKMSVVSGMCSRSNSLVFFHHLQTCAYVAETGPIFKMAACSNSSRWLQ